MTLSGAEYLASIFGTEKDKVNCSFFFKIGACRHGDKCSRLHNKPTFSQTILLQNFYHEEILPHLNYSRKSMRTIEGEHQRHFDKFFEEVFLELEDRYGEVEEINVCDNIGEHMIGNVYVKFREEQAAVNAEKHLNNRWFNKQPIFAHLSPVTDFREACCRQYEMGECARGGFCNFMHLKPISHELRRALYSREHPWQHGSDLGSSSNQRKNRKRRRRKRRKITRAKSRNHKRSKSKSRPISADDKQRPRSCSPSTTNNQDATTTTAATTNSKLPSAYTNANITSESSDSESIGNRSQPIDRSKERSESPKLPRAFLIHNNDRLEGTSESESEYESDSGSEDSYAESIREQLRRTKDSKSKS